ncbi:conserved hypothetical protein [Ricinus communis]|uniref:Calmodulin-binding protein n=1 Tax=Ricinus communis TaxID=3988 RepID=B9S793_RICCO|nr:conserved hypothetical protein [Ricinus communis]|eukprot:XP_002521862.1 uncharacterized protein LOC8283290 [Ricinus communis]
MEMEVVVAVPPVPVDFNFDSTCSSPYMTAPSSPQRFGNFFSSAPTSPTRSSSFFRELNDVSLATNSSSIPFDWEEKPGTPKARKNTNHDSEDFDFIDDGDFEFDFSGQLDRTSLSADELFDGGKIRPLKPPPGYDSSVSSPRSSSPRSRNAQKKKDFDPFRAAIEETTRREAKEQQQNQERRKHAYSQQRGRERTISGPSSSSSNKSSNYVHKGSRSLSPLRVSDFILDQEENNSQNNDKTITPTTPNPKSSYASSILSAISFSSKGYKKWKLKDFLLFRSASEGRATGKDPLTKYAVLSRREAADDVKNASFRSTDSSVGGSSRRRGPVSAHELHYTANRAVSEEMKRKTFLPYKQGLLGCLGFNPGVHEISRGIGSLARG